MKNKLSFGILCKNYAFEQWEADCIRVLIQHHLIELKILIFDARSDTQKLTLSQKLKQYPYKNFLYRAYKRFFLKAKAYQIVSLENELHAIPFIKCKTVRKGKHSDYFEEQDIAHIQSLGLDFLLRFGFNIIKGDILKSTQYGVWSFHHADNNFIRGGPVGFWEIFLKRNTSAAVLQQLNEKIDQGKILRKGYLKTVDHSFAQQIDQLMSMSATWPLQVCIEMLNGVCINEYKTNEQAVGRLYKYPTNAQFIYFTGKLFINKIRFHAKQLFLAESWQIVLLEGTLDDVVAGKKLSLKKLGKSTREQYVADPFFIPNQSPQKVLFESFAYCEKIGKIGIMDLQEQKVSFIDFGDQIHRSYPFTLWHEGACYCMPEQADSGKATLYRLDAQGEITERHDLILSFAARDSTLVFHQNKWWLFCTAAGDFENASLYIFHSNHLLGPYFPHANNPVKIDVRNARPAGNLFIKNGDLYRPAQSSASHYGHHLCINRITCLNEISFKEELVTSIDAVSFGKYVGIHHISAAQDQVLIDLKQSRFSWYNFIYECKRKLRKLF
jgi:hypothetical protein